MWKIATTLLFSLSTSSLWADNCRDELPPMPMSERFVVQADGTVKDNETGLMWKQCLEGLAGQNCRVGQVKKKNWSGAINYAKGYQFAGYSDWRLPSLEDLGPILAQKCAGPSTAASSVFPGDKNLGAWSSESSAYDDSYARYIHFNTGKNSTYVKSSHLPFRLVRQSN